MLGEGRGESGEGVVGYRCVGSSKGPGRHRGGEEHWELSEGEKQNRRIQTGRVQKGRMAGVLSWRSTYIPAIAGHCQTSKQELRGEVLPAHSSELKR